ncbi:extracellular solute-binding protein [Tropicimonas sediminicola]|uniref:Putative aldouronate transport system substrate-binding protein n=1 Tax=Tropicimonas sediminicola TaxID=1031541 RepID=A0A239HTA6_9RHOB|nr:extracellular solute-binding protein [Tropicimonas sediminicola]SNS84559.1 putative aldouronate transport system substrate-binding protein [Tropicimonas sediminicola]
MTLKTLLMGAVASAALLTPGSYGPAKAEPIVSEPLELDVFMHFRDKYGWNTDWPVAQKVAEATGITLNGTAPVGAGDSRELFNLMIASGDIPDIVGGEFSGAGVKEAFDQYGMEGAFLPLNDLIAEHAPDIQKVLDENPTIRAAISAPDGNIYYIPYLPDGDVGRVWFVRQDWLDALGLEQPRTVDELYDVLVAFRDKDPNGNGQADEVPYFNRHAEEAIRLVNLWGARSTGSDSYHQFYIEDGKVVHPYAHENFKVGISNVAAWYQEGLIDKEIFTRKSRARDELLGGNMGGVTHDWVASTAAYNDKLAAEIDGFSFLPMAPPADINGKVWEEHGRINVKPSGWAIGYSNEHPEETIKFFNFYFTEEGQRIANFGVEGLTYYMVDGNPVFKDSVLNGDGSVVAQLWEIGAQIPIGFPQDYEYERQWTNDLALKGIEMYTEGGYVVEQFPGIAMNAEEKAIYDKSWPNILSFMQESYEKWILGAADVEAEWSDYQAQLERLGYSDVLAALQTAYERQYGGSN